MSNEEEERRQWACPPATGTFDGTDLGLLDPSNEDERELLILAEHPELLKAVRDDVDEIELNGQVMSPRLHITLHRVVLNQLWNGDPPEVWQTVLRLQSLGYERHEILHMLMTSCPDVSIGRSRTSQQKRRPQAKGAKRRGSRRRK